MGTVIEKKPVALHWVRVASLYMNTTLCGQPLSSVTVCDEFADVTCKQCRRLGIANPQHQAKPRRVDSLMMRAFQDTEGELKTLVTEAREAIAEYNKAFDPDAENPRATRVAAVLGALVELLDPR